MSSQATALSAGKATIPPISWTPDLIYLLITVVEKPENRHFAIGKEDDSRTTPEHKTQGFQRIASAVIPTVYAQDAAAAGKRTQAKWDALKKTYREHSSRLFRTGEGVHDDAAQPQSQNRHQYADCYIPATGPDHTTTERARNVWDEITRDFPFFSRLHSLLSSRANANPYATTTGVGPNGSQTYHFQPPSTSTSTQAPIPVSENMIDPVLIAQSQAAAAAVHPAPTPQSTSAQPSTPQASSASPSEAPAVATSAQPALYGSEKLDNAVKKARAAIKPLTSNSTSSKRPHSSIEESFLAVSQSTLALVQKRHDAEFQLKRRRMDLEERDLLLRERKAGMISLQEVKARRKQLLQGLNYGDENSSPDRRHDSPTLSSPQASPVSPAARAQRYASPEWDMSAFDS